MAQTNTQDVEATANRRFAGAPGYKAWVNTPLGSGQIISQRPESAPIFDTPCHLVEFPSPKPRYGKTQWIPIDQIKAL